MLLTVAGAPFSFGFHTALEYGVAPDQPDVWLHLDLLVPSPIRSPRPAVVYLHGGAWETGVRSEAMYPWINPLLAAHGFVCASITYRLTDVAPFPAQIHDAKAAVRWLRGNADRFGIDPERIGVWGDSAGGHLAALLGVSAGVAELEGSCGTPDRSSSVQAVVARGAPTCFTPDQAPQHPDFERIAAKLFAGDRERLEGLASPLRHVALGAPPFLLVHGTADEVVPFAQARLLADALRSNGCDVTLHAVEGGHHNLRDQPDIPRSDEVMEQQGRLALAFFTRHLT